MSRGIVSGGIESRGVESDRRVAPMTTRLRAVWAAVAAVAPVAATLTAACPAAAAPQGTIRAGNVSYTLGPITAGQNESVDGDFTAHAAADNDVLFEQWWWYRVGGDADERVLRDDGTLTQSYAGSHADLDWSDVEGRGLIRAELDLDVQSTGATSGTLVSRLSITNIGASPITIQLYHYVDLDVCTADFNSALGTGALQSVTGSCASEVVDFRGEGIDHWCVEAFDTTECDIRLPGAVVLPDTGLPFQLGDWTGAMQWQDRVIGAGQTVAFVTRLEHNPPGCQGPATSVRYGTASGGAAGPPTFATTALPRIGESGTLSVGNVPANTTGALLFGFARANLTIGNVTVLVDITGGGAASLMADALGSATFSIPVPYEPQLCGAVLDWQFVFADATVVGQFPVGHTDGLEWTLGT